MKTFPPQSSLVPLGWKGSQSKSSHLLRDVLPSILFWTCECFVLPQLLCLSSSEHLSPCLEIACGLQHNISRMEHICFLYHCTPTCNPRTSMMFSRYCWNEFIKEGRNRQTILISPPLICTPWHRGESHTGKHQQQEKQIQVPCHPLQAEEGQLRAMRGRDIYVWR